MTSDENERGVLPSGTSMDRRNGHRAGHIPVLLAEVLETLAPADGEIIVDGTFGAGGYTSAVLDRADCRVVAFDRDITAVRAGAAVCARYHDRLRLINQPFGEMDRHVRRVLMQGADTPDGTGWDGPLVDGPLVDGPLVDGVVLDIGVSSMQIDQPERGFSFQHDGPLDMRMSTPLDPASGLTSEVGPGIGPSAADYLATADEDDIARVLFEYGEERKSRLIARAIVHDRATTPFTSTRQLAGLVSRLLGGRGDDGRHPATRTFQALRIHVNDELGELERGLVAAERLLKPGGRLVVVTFHSLEDRIVKRFLLERSGRAPAGSRHLPPQNESDRGKSFRIVNQRPLTSSQPELDANPRARSARLRAAVRTEAPPYRAP